MQRNNSLIQTFPSIHFTGILYYLQSHVIWLHAWESKEISVNWMLWINYDYKCSWLPPNSLMILLLIHLFASSNAVVLVFLKRMWCGRKVKLLGKTLSTLGTLWKYISVTGKLTHTHRGNYVVSTSYLGEKQVTILSEMSII